MQIQLPDKFFAVRILGVDSVKSLAAKRVRLCPKKLNNGKNNSRGHWTLISSLVMYSPGGTRQEDTGGPATGIVPGKQGVAKAWPDLDDRPVQKLLAVVMRVSFSAGQCFVSFGRLRRMCKHKKPQYSRGQGLTVCSFVR